MAKVKEEKNEILEIFHHLPLGLLFFDKKNKLFLINPLAEDFLSIRAKKIIGKSISELTRFPKLRPLIDLFGKRFRRIFQREVQIRKNLILEVFCFPVLRKGRKVGTLVILDDIAREKEIERMKIQFISLAAHQFRTPLSAIKWGLKILLEEEMGELNKKQKDFLEKIYHSNERMIVLVKDLSIVTRIEEGKYICEPAFLQIEKIVQSAIDSYKKEIKRKEIKFKFKKPEKRLSKIFGDVKKLKLAIQNLLGNSLSYIKIGGKVTISLKGRRKEIEFKIEDDGVGIPKNQQKKVFKKFFRGANVIRMGTEGTGLNLFITKNIIEAHKGKIWFKSRENKGTSFYFTLPVEKV